MMDPYKYMKRYRKMLKKLVGEDVFRDIGIFKAEIEVPLLNVGEEKEKYIYEFHVPGFKKDEVKVEVDEGYLKVRGEKKESKEEKGKRYLYKEIERQSFERVVYLPLDADAANIKAKMEDGVLRVEVPKKKGKIKVVEID